MNSLHVVIMVHAVMLGPANVKMVSMVPIAQVNFITCVTGGLLTKTSLCYN